MEQMILKRLKILDDLTAEMNSLKENLEDLLDNDPLYQEMQEKSEEVNEEKKAIKSRMMSNTTYTRLQEEIKDKRQDIKENKEALSVELVEHYRQNGTLEIKDENGNVKRMKFSVRLVN